MTDAQSRDEGESPGPSDIDRAENVKHLELIQAVVTRLASNSFLIKGWTLTVAAAAFGFAVNRIDWRIGIAGLVVVAGFWMLDAYYLRQERLFRHLYDHVRQNVGPALNDRFSMNPDQFNKIDNVKRHRVAFSSTLLAFYPLLAIAGIVVTVLSAVFATAAQGTP